MNYLKLRTCHLPAWLHSAYFEWIVLWKFLHFIEMILQVPRIAQFIYSQKVPNIWRFFVQLLLKTDDSCTESLSSIQNWKPLKIVSGFKSSSLEFGDSSFMNCRELVEVSFDDRILSLQNHWKRIQKFSLAVKTSKFNSFQIVMRELATVASMAAVNWSQLHFKEIWPKKPKEMLNDCQN